MFKIFKNKYLPLKSTEIDYKTEKYLIWKIDHYLLNISCELTDSLKSVDKIIKKGYSEEEAKDILDTNALSIIYDNLSRVKENLQMAKGLSDDDIAIINKVYSNTKLRFNIFDPIALIPKKVK